MSTRVLKALPGKIDIKRHSPSILYIYSEIVPENKEEGSIIRVLDVANQEGPVECTIDSEENSQGQGGGSVFTIERDVFRRNCILRLADNVQLDYEKKTKYFLRVHVRHQRLKRQGGYDGYSNNGLVVFPLGLI